MHILHEGLTVFYWSIHCGLHCFAVTDSELGNNSIACRVFGALAKLLKATMSFVMSVRLLAWKDSVPNQQIFMKFYISIF